jgi:hypothetical protein
MEIQYTPGQLTGDPDRAYYFGISLIRAVPK